MELQGTELSVGNGIATGNRKAAAEAVGDNVFRQNPFLAKMLRRIVSMQCTKFSGEWTDGIKGSLIQSRFLLIFANEAIIV